MKRPLPRKTQEAIFVLWIVGWIAACAMLCAVVSQIQNTACYDTQDRTFMGRGSQGQCLYEDITPDGMETRGNR
jgi:hypothetical protein